MTLRVKAIRGQVVALEAVGGSPQVHEVFKSGEVLVQVYLMDDKAEVFGLILKGEKEIRKGMELKRTGKKLSMPVGKELLGRAVNMFGEPLDGKDLKIKEKQEIWRTDRIKPKDGKLEVWETGIKVIDFFAPLVKGGKLGLFGGAGVGKTVLLTEIMQSVFVQKGHVKKENAIQQGPASKLRFKNGPYATDTVAVFAGVGERTREADELYDELKVKKVLDQTSLILGMMSQNAALRFTTAFAGVTVAEYFRDELNKNVLFFIDNVFRFAQAGSELTALTGVIPSEEGYQPTLGAEMAQFHERLVSSDNSVVSSIEAIYVPADDMLDQAVVAVQPYLTSVVALSRDVYQQGYMPAVDVLNSGSSALSKEVVGERHLTAVTEAKKVLKKASELERMVSLVGEAELSEENRQTYRRASLIKAFMTQPFRVVAEQTGVKGEQVRLKQTVIEVEKILKGQFDKTDPDKLMFKGSLKGVR